MLKNISKLECKINDKDFQFTCDCDCSTQLVKHALIKFLRYADEVEDSNINNSNVAETQAEPELEIQGE